MPINKNKDGTLSLSDDLRNESVASPRVGIAPNTQPMGGGSSANESSLEGNTEPRRTLSGVDWGTPDDLESSGVDWGVEEDVSLIGEDVRDTAAGIANGITNMNFVSNMGKVVESWMPGYIPSRLQMTDDNGDFDPHFSTGAEFLGISNEEWSNTDSDKLRVMLTNKTAKDIAKQFGASRSSDIFTIASIVGSVVDPTTVVGAGRTATEALITGKAVGGGVSATRTGIQFGTIGAADFTAYQAAYEGNATVGGAAMGFVLAGSLGAGIQKGISKYRTGFTATSKSRIKASTQLDNFGTVLKHNTDKYDNPVMAYQKTLKELGTTHEFIDDLGIKAGYGKQAPRKRSKISREINEFIEPISERIKQIGGKALHKGLQKAEMEMKTNNHVLVTMSDDFLAAMDAAPLNPFKRGGLIRTNPDAHRDIWHGLMNNMPKKQMHGLIEKHMGKAGLAKYTKYTKSNEHTYKMLVEVNGAKHVGPKLDTYMQRVLKDPEDIDKVLAATGKTEAKAHKIALERLVTEQKADTKEKLARLYNDYFNGRYNSTDKIQTVGARKSRRIKDIPRDLLDLYQPPSLATHSQIRDVTEEYSRKRFFGKAATTEHGDNLSKTIGAYAEQEMRKGNIGIGDVKELKNLLELRFDKGVIASPEWVQRVKNYGYIMTLGNPISAITQFGDVALSVYKNGARNTMVGIADTFGKRGLTPKEFGLMESMLEELASTSASKKWLTKSLDIGQFSRVDQFGKSVVMNAALRKNRLLAEGGAKGIAKLRTKYGEAFGKDFNQLVIDLQRVKNPKTGKMEHRMVKNFLDDSISEPPPDVRAVIFMELAEIQPITLLEMPAAYLNNPRGRLAYMLRTFQIKYFNLLRRAVGDGFAKGDYKEGIKNGVLLMAAMSAGGVATDNMKNLVLGRREDLVEQIADNTIKSTGVLSGRYTADKIIDGSKPLTSLASSLAPPIGIYDPLARAAIQIPQGNFDQGLAQKVVGKVPIMGPLISNYLLGGRTDWNKEHR